MSNRLKEYTEELSKRANEADAILEKASTEKREVKTEEQESVNKLLARCKELQGIIKTEKDVSEVAAAAKKSVEEARAMPNRDVSTISDAEKREIDKFDVVAFFNAASSRRPLEGRERELSEEAVLRGTRNGCKFQNTDYVLPVGLLRAAAAKERRDINVTTGSAGGYTIQTDVSDLLDIPFNLKVFDKIGATIFPNLTNNLSIPRFQANTDPAFNTETGAQGDVTPITESQVTLAPKRLPGKVIVSNEMLKQKSTIKNWVLKQMDRQFNAKLQKAIIYGGSANEPTGILATAGIGGGSLTSGATGGPLTWANALGLETAVVGADIYGDNLNYLTNIKVVNAAKQILRVSGVAAGLIMEGSNSIAKDGINGVMNGYNVFATNGVPSNLTKSTGTNLSALIFGAFEYLWIGFWSDGVEVLVDPLTGADNGQTKLHFAAFADAKVVLPPAFAALQDIAA
jgi:HK97 family phage major capsid protein